MLENKVCVCVYVRIMAGNEFQNSERKPKELRQATDSEISTQDPRDSTRFNTIQHDPRQWQSEDVSHRFALRIWPHQAGHLSAINRYQPCPISALADQLVDQLNPIDLLLQLLL